MNTDDATRELRRAIESAGPSPTAPVSITRRSAEALEAQLRELEERVRTLKARATCVCGAF